MIRVFATSSAEWLDIAPAAEFEIEMSNPLFESDGFPVAVSTSISFPPSEKNRKVFGYFPAMFLPPTVTKLSAKLFFDGIPILDGILSYDQVDEDGNLLYMFAERALSDMLDKKLFQLEHLPSANSNPDTLANNVIAGNVPGVGAPLLYDPSADEPYKFYNAPGFPEPFRFTPCVSFQLLFSETDILSIDASLLGVWNNLWILGLHKAFSGSWKGYGDTLSIADSLPDMALIDLLRLFAKMTCSTVFSSKGAYYVIPFNKILEGIPVVIDDKVSDVGAAFSKEDAKGYVFGYSEDSNKKNDAALGNEDVEAHSYKDVIDSADSREDQEEAQYITAWLRRTGETFSVPPYASVEMIAYAIWVQPNGNRVIIERAIHACDLLNSGDVYRDTSIDGQSVDNSLDCELIKAVPVHSPNLWYKLAARVDYPADDAQRETKAIIGEFNSGQMVRHGIVMNADGSETSFAGDLTADRLYNSFHTEFAEWIAKERQVIKVETAFAPQDIAEFRMWNRVMLKNRLFLIRKLNVRMSAKSGRILSSAELVSL